MRKNSFSSTRSFRNIGLRLPSPIPLLLHACTGFYNRLTSVKRSRSPRIGSIHRLICILLTTRDRGIAAPPTVSPARERNANENKRAIAPHLKLYAVIHNVPPPLSVVERRRPRVSSSFARGVFPPIILCSVRSLGFQGKLPHRYRRYRGMFARKKMEKSRVSSAKGRRRNRRSRSAPSINIHAFAHLLYERCGFISIHNT